MLFICILLFTQGYFTIYTRFTQGYFTIYTRFTQGFRPTESLLIPSRHSAESQPPSVCCLIESQFPLSCRPPSADYSACKITQSFPIMQIFVSNIIDHSKSPSKESLLRLYSSSRTHVGDDASRVVTIREHT